MSVTPWRAGAGTGGVLALHHDARFLRSPGAFERAEQTFLNVLARYRATPN